MAANTRPHQRRRAAQPTALVALALLLLLAPAAAQTSAFEGPFLGRTDDPCRLDSDCVAPLNCRKIREAADPIPCDPLNNESCSCVLSGNRFVLCKSSADCPTHERCIAPGGNAANGARCSSCSAFFMVQSVTQPVDDTSSVCPSPTPTPTPRGFGLDECDPSLENPCVQPATCARFDDETLVVCKPGDTACDCQPRETLQCLDSSHCPPGERCVARGFDADRPTQCVSCVVAQNHPQIFRFTDLHPPSCAESAIAAALAVPTATPTAQFQPHCPASRGVTLDFCCADDGAPRCAFPRRCASVFTKQQCRPGEVACVCLSPATAGCETSEACPVGEVCVHNGETNMCISCSRVVAGRVFQVVDDGLSRCDDAPKLYVAPVPIYPSPSPVGPVRPRDEDGAYAEDGEGVPDASGEPEMSTGPAAPRLDPLLAGEAEAQRGLPADAEATDEPAATGETEGETDGSDADADGAADTSAATTAVSTGVCIGAHHLREIPDHELVFATHARADVLCDASRSCATPGHIVVWRGDPMSMRAYCAQVACARATMHVNSVRMRRARRVASDTDGLAFTALAARWGTAGEEAVLRALVRLGL